MSIPSATAGYRFEFTATVHWQSRSGTPERDRGLLSARAREVLMDRAIAVTQSIAADDPVLAGYRLASALSVRENDQRAGVDVWATDVTARISDDDMRRLRNLQDITKEVQLREYERALERELRRYLGDDVLTSTGSALVWWLARHLDEIDGAVAQIPALARISAVAQDRVEPEYANWSPAVGSATTSSWLLDDGSDTLGDPGARGPVDTPARAPHRTMGTNARDLLDSLFPGDDTGRLMAARQLAALADRWGRGEFAGAIRDGFDRPSPGEPASATNGSTLDGQRAANFTEAEAAGTTGAGAVITDDDSSGAPTMDPENPDSPRL